MPNYNKTCYFWQQDRCNKGDDCPYRHYEEEEPSENEEEPSENEEESSENEEEYSDQESEASEEEVTDDEDTDEDSGNYTNCRERRTRTVKKWVRENEYRAYCCGGKYSGSQVWFGQFSCSCKNRKKQHGLNWERIRCEHCNIYITEMIPAECRGNPLMLMRCPSCETTYTTGCLVINTYEGKIH